MIKVYLISGEPKIDVLMNNAGVMMLPQGKTVDGFETQFATNVLGEYSTVVVSVLGASNAIKKRVWDCPFCENACLGVATVVRKRVCAIRSVPADALDDGSAGGRSTRK